MTTKSKNILFLGTNPEKYESLGHIVHFPMIEISSARIDPSLESQILTNLAKYDLIILTSRFAVQYFFEWLKDKKVSLEELKTTGFAVIGQITHKALNDLDFQAKVVADVETSEGLWTALREGFNIKNKRILFPRSSLTNPFLKEHLCQDGCEVDELPIYQNTKPSKRDLPSGPIDCVVFTSPSTVRNFLEDYGTIPDNWLIFSKGPRTSEALNKAGYESEVLKEDV